MKILIRHDPKNDSWEFMNTDGQILSRHSSAKNMAVHLAFMMGEAREKGHKIEDYEIIECDEEIESKHNMSPALVVLVQTAQAVWLEFRHSETNWLSVLADKINKLKKALQPFEAVGTEVKLDKCPECGGYTLHPNGLWCLECSFKSIDNMNVT